MGVQFFIDSKRMDQRTLAVVADAVTPEGCRQS
jgi:hypothetical protein